MRFATFKPQHVLLSLATTVVAVAALYFGQPIILPVVLGILLAFLLSPIVVSMERLGLGRVFAVVVTVVLSTCLLLVAGWALYLQLADLAQELPSYRQNIRQKITDLRGLRRNSPIEKVQETVEDVSEELKKTSEDVEAEVDGDPAESEPSSESRWAVPVKIESGSQAFSLESLPSALRPMARPLATCGIAMVLVIFMLIRKEDLRNRLLRLTGDSRLALATRIMDEVGARISRFLLAQFVLNVSFGTAIAIGLYVIGLPHALLWGILAAALRYIPYLGPWLGACAPILLSVIAFDGWTQPLLVAGLFAVLELLSNNFFEPLLYGRSVGVSPVAVLISALFWGWLWGPFGLLLSTPIAVCLMVLGRYVPHFESFFVLLGDEPVLDPAQRYYQRLLARDRREATALVHEQLEASSLRGIADNLLIPTLVRVREERRDGYLEQRGEQYVIETTRAVFTEALEASSAPVETAQSDSRPARFLIYGCPARDEVDVTALEIFAALLTEVDCEIEVASPEALCSEMLERVEQSKASFVCVAALPPDGVARARYVCRRMRQRFPDVRILVGRWGLSQDGAADAFEAEGIDRVTVTLGDSVEQVKRWSLNLPGRANREPNNEAYPQDQHPHEDPEGPVPHAATSG